MKPADPDPRPAVDEPDLPLPSVLDDPYRVSRLTAGQRAAWAAVTALADTLNVQLEARLHRECGMTPFEFHLLYVIGAGDAAARAGDGELAMSRLAHLVDASLSRLSHGVRRLEERGWLERRQAPQDARVTLVRLAPEGRSRLSACLSSYDGIVRQLLVGRLSDRDLAELRRLSLLLLSALREDHWLVATLGGGAPEQAPAEPGTGPERP